MGEETLDVVLSLGSNLGNKEQNLKSAIYHLHERVGKVLKGYNIVTKGNSKKWLERNHVRIATPEEVAREFGK
jgi:7,8-dihydro-6-hydroxymethylpterin-pyrophosphokinase